MKSFSNLTFDVFVKYMLKNNKKWSIYIASERNIWLHELRSAKILALAGYCVEFLSETSLRSPDIRLDGVEYEIKSPEIGKISSLEQIIRTTLR